MAHVDAGKTTLTERLLYATGAIDHIGSVDAGTTQTDSLELERQRGITIRSAVASFVLGDVTVNLIDTPGHPDFIAEVERVLYVLDGAVLVLSAVEGVQPQTRVLLRALQRLRVPTLLFVNKIDRPGAGYDRVLDAIARRLGTATVPMGTVDRLGTPGADFTAWTADELTAGAKLLDVLSGHDDRLLATYVDDEAGITDRRLRDEFAAQVKRALVHPVFFGSAMTGAGIPSLLHGLLDLLPVAAGDPDGPPSGRVFKVERAETGEKIAYVRVFTGTIRTRDRLGSGADRVTGISVYDAGTWVRRDRIRAGEIGKLRGLGRIRVGDTIAADDRRDPVAQFPPPMLETVVVPDDADGRGRLRVALTQLAEQDPLINVRQDDARRELSVSLYGEVQKEVLQATLASDFGIAVGFRETTVLCVERPTRAGEAVELLNTESNPYRATIGLRIEPAPVDSGVEFRLRVDTRTVPMYVYKNVENFTAAMDQYVRDALREGRFGWEVTDCVVTLVRCLYSVADGPPSTRGPLSTAADFRKLTPLVLGQALRRAAPVVCEPVVRATVEAPTASLGAVVGLLARLGTGVHAGSPSGYLSTVEAVLPAARVRDVQRQLPGLTGGEGALDTTFAGYRPGPPITRG